MEQPELPQLHISGQAPKLKWELNGDGQKRSIVEALSIAMRHGVNIPDDVVFFEAEQGDLAGDWEELIAGNGTTAKGPGVAGDLDGCIYWEDHLNRFGRIPFEINPAVLASDEAIVAVITHELYELEHIRALFASVPANRLSAADYQSHVTAGLPGNMHDQAWAAADEAVRRMREVKS